MKTERYERYETEPRSTTDRLWLGAGLLLGAGLFIGIWISSSSAETNLWTHSSSDGMRHVSNCDPDNGGFVARVEDEPCWLIQSPASDFEVPFMARWAKDYRP